MKLIDKLKNTYSKEIVRDTFNMAWPSIIESFFVALAGIIDSLMVSSLGSTAVAAVGLTTQPKNIGFAMFTAVNVSISALVARRRGEKRRDDANRLFVTAFLMVIVLSVLMGAAFFFWADTIISWCGSTEETHDMAATYIRVIMTGMIFNTIQMVVNAAQRGAGNTKITMRTNLTSSIVNIIFNYLLINGHFGFPALGIFGAALATVLGTVVACVMSLLSIRGKNDFISIPLIIKNRMLPRLAALKSIVKIGYSVALEQILLRIGFMATAIMAADQGTYAMAAHQVGMNILGLSFAFGDGLQAAAVALIGRSLGENNPDKAKKCGECCKIGGLMISLVLAVIFVFFGRAIYSLFFEETEIIDIGQKIMYIQVVTVIFQIRQVINTGALRGAGDTFYTAVMGVISVVFIRSIVSYLGGYVFGLGIIGIWFGVLADQMSRYIFMSLRYRSGKWMHIKI